MRLSRRPRTIGVAVSSAAFGLVLAGGQLFAQAPLSGGITTVATPVHEASPRLFTGPKGEVLRVSSRGVTTGSSSIIVASPAGNEWKTVVEVVPPDKDVTVGNADLAVGPAGQITVAYQWWRRMPASSKQIRIAQSTDGGKTWAQPTSSLDTSGKAFAPKVAWGRDQSLVVAWADEQRSNRVWDVFARRSPDGGATWEPEQLLSRFAFNSPNDAYIRPEIVSDDDKTFLVFWVGIRSGRSRLFLSRSTDGGASWANPVELSGQSQSVFGQRVARAGERVLVVWQDKRTGRDRLFGVTSTDNGVTWSPPVRVDHLADDQQTDAFAPTVVMTPAGEAFVVWNDGRNGRDDIFVGRSGDGGRTWDDKDVRLDMDEAGTAVSRFPKIVRATDGRLAVAWEDDRAGYEGVYVRVRSAGNKPTWGPEVVVEAGGQKKAARLPSVMWMPNGSLQLAWEVWDYAAGAMAVSKRLDGRAVTVDGK